MIDRLMVRTTGGILPPRVLILGFGNDLRGDDALGPMAVSALRERLRHPSVEMLDAVGLTPELASHVARAGHVIFIDCRADGTPGELHCEPVNASAATDVSMVHFLDPAGLLSWSATLFGRRPGAEVFSITGACFDVAEGLTPTVRERFEALLSLVLASVRARLCILEPGHA